MTQRTPALLRENVDHTRAICERNLRHLPSVLAELRELMTTGYASHTSAAGEPGGGGGISDPTASAALHGSREAVEARDAWDSAWDAAESTLRYAKVLQDILAPYVEQLSTRPAPDPLERGFALCANQYGCPDVPAYAVRRGRCAACSAFLSRQGTDRRKGRTAA